MQQNSTAFQDALARAKQIAQKLSAAAPNAGPLKRPNNDDEPSNKRPAFDDSSPVLRAQLVAQKISSQLGLKSSGELVPLSNQLGSQDDYHIPDKYVGLIIGKGGEQITRIQQETGCKVQISPLRTESANSLDGPERIANLSGTREAIERARKVMDEIVSRGRAAENGANPYAMNSSKAVEVMLPSAKCGLIIGKGGENIRRIMDEYTVKLFVGQETIDIDGIEHKPLKITGDADKAEVSGELFFVERRRNALVSRFSERVNTFSTCFRDRDRTPLRHVPLLLLLPVNRRIRVTAITVREVTSRQAPGRAAKRFITCRTTRRASSLAKAAKQSRRSIANPAPTSNWTNFTSRRRARRPNASSNFEERPNRSSRRSN